MKRLFTLLAIIMFYLIAGAQAPHKMSYQCVIRNATGILVTNHSIGIRTSILQGSAGGTVIYQETYNPNPQTNTNGLVTMSIGEGIPSTGTFSAINWASGPYYLKTETDPAGGTDYTIVGTSPILSTPYALYSNKAESLNLTSAPSNGAILFFNNSIWNLLTKGNEGQVLKTVGGLPQWYASELPVLPIATTNSVTEITQTTAKCGGLAMANGNTQISVRGVCWSTTQNPSVNDMKTQDGSGLGDFISILTGLTPGTTYYTRAYATNSSGTSYGNQVSFKTILTITFPAVTTTAAINITESSAVSGGNVTTTGGAEVIAKGVCWSTNQNPTVADSKTNDGTGSEQFASQLVNLNPGTVYYVRAYATNSGGTGYGGQVTFTTVKTIPAIVTKNITSISAMGAISGGTITLSGGGTISNKGICWSELENPTTIDNTVSAGTGTSAFNSAIGLLKPNTVCYVRAYAVNEIGIAYGDQKSFTTSDGFYDGFESGFSGSTGGWGIVTGDAIEGAYSLHTSVNGSEVSLTRTLTNSGQFSFYVKVPDNNDNVAFYIDNVIQGTYSNNFWGLQTYPVSNGPHTFKWRYNDLGASYYPHDAWIDFIVMPK